MMKFRLLLILLVLTGFCYAQNPATPNRRNLDRYVNLDIRQQPISGVLSKMSKDCNFYFAYSTSILKQDSIVNIKVKDMPVRDVLDQLFDGKVDYKENGEYIILRYAANHLTIEPENITTADNLYLISGFIVDTRTGKKVKQASVYEKRLIQSTLTDDNGFFSLKFKGDYNAVVLTASKESYRDTSLVFLSDIAIKPEGVKDGGMGWGTAVFNSIENSGISRFFISSRQRIQSLNIPYYLANSPFQASILPGFSSHGIMSSQVVNKLSLNILGGYTAGVDGVELAGLFNINKGNVRSVQFAGLFNTVGGSVEGVQGAGLVNDVRTNMEGIQMAGLFNHVIKNAKGIQLAGLGNVVSDSLTGIQVAGLGNITSKATDGIQIAGLGNITSKSLNGMQIAGLVNYATDMNGVQIGLINISGRNTGYSIGLINYVHHGYHKISLSSNETIHANISLKTGNSKLYNIILAGKNYGDSARIETAGLGFGHDIIFNNTLSAAAEITGQFLYLGNWDYTNTLTRIQTNLQLQVFKGLTLYGGPVYSIYSSNAPTGSSAKGYKQQIAPAKHHSFDPNVKGWLGWNVGITIM
ncbi:STN and carboxypeptidase regulatory-like domain-containing protein [Pedobacter metabolipauper]|uniref:Carboxypeptidase-like protein n=1 Tax=Pedobacter metabolipauper TaxID=425513 RepID=A0A4R6T1V0_9SPHI|nr:STN and carboxypeptidase regulatory-like domain-containing protein [Pedobacter metabolipauper]TDQ12059.1 hypothetical protein ATK78_1190 [Pedobacter metabolipauper]